MAHRCSLIGMPPSVAKDALTVNPQRAVMRGCKSPSAAFLLTFSRVTILKIDTRASAVSLRQTYRGVISNPTLTTYPPPPRESDSDISEQQQRPNPNSEAPTLPAPVPTPASELGKKRPAAAGGCGSDSALETTGKALREITGGGGGDGRVQQPDGSVPSVPTQQPKRKKKRKE